MGWFWQLLWNRIKAFVMNPQRSSRAYEVGEEHYDLGNDLFRHRLDERMIYGSGYWRRVTTLNEAQEAKLDLICQKRRLEPEMRVLGMG